MFKRSDTAAAAYLALRRRQLQGFQHSGPGDLYGLVQTILGLSDNARATHRNFENEVRWGLQDAAPKFNLPVVHPRRNQWSIG
ncbi:hypothetical protein LCGC14_1747210 [marine sediment metagenome]|uniref:Uncharacterized protein n=1 Tax=marine sediment metagenome TaxID=412755 RepID=A0A0F9H4Z5_9ZZZZ